MCPSGGIDELSRDAHPVCRFANAAFQHVAHPKLAPDLLHIDGAPLVGEAGVAGDDEQRLEMRQRRDDVLDHSVGEIVLLRIAAHVGEWQNSDGGLIGKRKGGLRFWRNCSLSTAFDRQKSRTLASVRAMFFSAISPLSSKHTLILPRT